MFLISFVFEYLVKIYNLTNILLDILLLLVFLLLFIITTTVVLNNFNNLYFTFFSKIINIFEELLIARSS